MNLLTLRPVASCKGYRSYTSAMFAVCDADGKRVAVLTSYESAAELLSDSPKVVSKWNTIRLAPLATPFQYGAGHGLLP